MHIRYHYGTPFVLERNKNGQINQKLERSLVRSELFGFLIEQDRAIRCRMEAEKDDILTTSPNADGTPSIEPADLPAVSCPRLS
jgi:hypothetical protein